jgi:hypothetical protein
VNQRARLVLVCPAATSTVRISRSKSTPVEKTAPSADWA